MYFDTENHGWNPYLPGEEEYALSEENKDSLVTRSFPKPDNWIEVSEEDYKDLMDKQYNKGYVLVVRDGQLRAELPIYASTFEDRVKLMEMKIASYLKQTAIAKGFPNVDVAISYAAFGSGTKTFQGKVFGELRSAMYEKFSQLIEEIREGKREEPGMDVFLQFLPNYQGIEEMMTKDKT